MRTVPLLMLLVAVQSASYFPEITLSGENPLQYGPSKETYVDPGATCYDPYADKSHKITMDQANSDTVNLGKDGTYYVTYTCKDSGGNKATPKKRTITVSKQFQEDWWEGEASIQMTGYTKATFGKAQQTGFRTALSTALQIPFDELTITKIADGKKANSVDVAFLVKCIQEALIREVVNRMKDPKFDNLLASELQKQKVQVQGDALAVEKVSFKEVMTTTLLAGLGVGGFLGLTFLAVGAYKLHQLAHAGNINLGAGSEKSPLTGHSGHDRL